MKTAFNTMMLLILSQHGLKRVHMLQQNQQQKKSFT